MERRIVVVSASAPAKVILLGEHFVVHGAPALVMAIDRRVSVAANLRSDKQIYIKSEAMELSGYFSTSGFQIGEGRSEALKELEPIHMVIRRILNLSKRDTGINVEIRSSVPIAVGLGSSASVSVATAAAVSRLLDVQVSKDEVFHIAYDAERLIHGSPSGVDPAISTYGGVLLYIKEKGITPLNIEVDVPLVIGNTGIARSTGEMVAKVHDLRRRYTSIVDPLIKSCGNLVEEAIKALGSGELGALGELMNINHAMLSAVGVSNESLDRLVYAARNAGALGAKLTGAGGGGCMIALVLPEKNREVAEAIEQAGGKAFLARKTDEGVRIEE